MPVFKKIVVESKFLTPLRDFEGDAQSIEYRRDPLLSTWCRINVRRTERVKQWKSDANFWELVEKSEKGCFFCPDNIPKSTPKFPPEIAPEGRIKLGETFVFPNLFPFAQHHAIATLTRKHFADLHEFTEDQIANTLNASIDYFKRVAKAYPRVKYPSFNWNHLPPSGASILHPHVQLVADERPTRMVDLSLKASAKYYGKNKGNYWLDLIEAEEKENARFIGKSGSIAWMTTFAPMGNNEITAIFEESANLDISAKEVEAFASGLARILKGYYELGVKSFNLTMYSAALGERRDDYRLNIKLISRPPPLRDYTSDAGFMETLHMERVVESMPEKLAESMRLFFGAAGSR